MKKQKLTLQIHENITSFIFLSPIFMLLDYTARTGHLDMQNVVYDSSRSTGSDLRATEGNLGQRVIWDIFEHNSLF